ncbi:MAG TPA: TatD family hydrolase [Chitinophagaceae bacterium]|jgi:TatD DNase family protein
MSLIDTHCHIYDTAFDTDREAMLSRAQNEGITKMLMPAIDVSTHVNMLELEALHPALCLSMMGLHPCSVKENWQHEMNQVEAHFLSRKFVAVGETGLDFYWDRTFIKEQEACFRRQIELAKTHGVPVVIHSRESTDDCIRIVREYQDGALRGVFHCFSGTVDQAKQIVDLDFFMGIGGVLTFKNSGLDAVLREMGLQRVVLETDAPYLAPVPFRGKRNECSYLAHIAAKAAAIMQMPEADVATVTTANAVKLFQLDRHVVL